MGDLNEWVGNKDEEIERKLGKEEKKTTNQNGERIIKRNDLVITV